MTLQKAPRFTVIMLSAIAGTSGCDPSLEGGEIAEAAFEPSDELVAEPHVSLDCINNVALTANFANSSPGWGGGASFTDLNDGLVAYPWWAEGLAFTGGNPGWGGQPCGLRYATMQWAMPVLLETVFVWHHGPYNEHLPTNAEIEVWNGAGWVVAPSTWSVRWDLETSLYLPGYASVPTEHVLDAPVSTTMARYVTNNCGITGHGWLYEVAAYGPCDPECGDGVVNGTEECDDTGESPTCNIDCTTSTCGDGLLNTTAGEACDHAGESPTCDTDCTVAACGDDVVNMAAGEACDDAGQSPTCDTDCSPAKCGDGQVNGLASETCDDAGESLACDSDCSPATCGDGTVDHAAGEACDGMGESVLCDVDCTVASCGDSVVNTTAGETCDDGVRSASCNGDCTVASCGDGLVNEVAGEQCDGDGQGTPGETSGCDHDCTLAVCGDTVINESAGEQCDSGAASETCDADCTEVYVRRWSRQ